VGAGRQIKPTLREDSGSNVLPRSVPKTVLRDRRKAKAQENQGFLMVEAGGIEHAPEGDDGKKDEEK